MYLNLHSVSFIGLDTIDISVEINVYNRGMPQFNIVGLAGRAVEESKHRIIAALQNSAIDLSLKKVTVNLAPADVPKNGSSYDLPIVAGLICCLVPKPQLKYLSESIFYGELSLDGSIRSCKGAFVAALHAADKGYRYIFIGDDPSASSWGIKNIQVIALKNLHQLKEIIVGDLKPVPVPVAVDHNFVFESACNINAITGQVFAKRALEISAAGGHSIMFVGPPGVGKTLLANVLPSLLPPINSLEYASINKIHSLAGNSTLLKTRPFRTPHHSISFYGMFGGGANPVPGEITLAHKGVLFLDEFGEFSLDVIEGLRKPMEEGEIALVRHNKSYIFPAKFILIAASNPCPCGFFGHEEIKCKCSNRQVERYRSRFPGPLLDRIDLFVNLCVDKNPCSPVDIQYLRKKIKGARLLQQVRYKGASNISNGSFTMPNSMSIMKVSSSAELISQKVMTKFHLSFRSYTSLIRVARTIADLECSEEILDSHILEAAQYRYRF